jgi:hypothetical protein
VDKVENITAGLDRLVAVHQILEVVAAVMEAVNQTIQVIHQEMALVELLLLDIRLHEIQINTKYI